MSYGEQQRRTRTEKIDPNQPIPTQPKDRMEWPNYPWLFRTDPTVHVEWEHGDDQEEAKARVEGESEDKQKHWLTADHGVIPLHKWCTVVGPQVLAQVWLSDGHGKMMQGKLRLTFQSPVPVEEIYMGHRFRYPMKNLPPAFLMEFGLRIARRKSEHLKVECKKARAPFAVLPLCQGATRIRSFPRAEVGRSLPHIHLDKICQLPAQSRRRFFNLYIHENPSAPSKKLYYLPGVEYEFDFIFNKFDFKGSGGFKTPFGSIPFTRFMDPGKEPPHFVVCRIPAKGTLETDREQVRRAVDLVRIEMWHYKFLS